MLFRPLLPLWKTRFALPLKCYIIITYIQQYDSICRSGLAVVALTLNILAKDPSIRRRLDKSAYIIIFALPEVILGARSWFWQKTVRDKKNRFYRRLKYIAIDEANVI